MTLNFISCEWGEGRRMVDSGVVCVLSEGLKVGNFEELYTGIEKARFVLTLRALPEIK